MSNNDNLISLLNCEFSNEKTRLNSPHSIMACELIGVTINDLIQLPKEEYIKKNPDCKNISKEFQEERYNHYNQSRIKLIKEAKKMREQLINQEKETSTNNNNSSSKNSKYSKKKIYNYRVSNDFKNKTYRGTFYCPHNMKKCSSTNTLDGGCTAIKVEREKLKKLKERQETNILLQIDYECALEENRRKNLMKMRDKELKEEKIAQEKKINFIRKNAKRTTKRNIKKKKRK